MGVRSRTIGLVAAASFGLWVVVALSVAGYAVHTSNEADTREAAGALTRSAAAIASRQEALVAITGDWAPWDDSYDFVRSHDKASKAAYVRNNLPDTTFTNLGVDFVILTDSSGRIVYAKALDPTTRQAATIPAGLERYLATRPAMLRSSDPREVVSGTLSLVDGPYVLAAQPIGKSDFSVAPNGTFITGYRAGPGLRSKIQAVTLRPIDVYSSACPTLPVDVRSARASLDSSAATLIVDADDKTAYAYDLLPGFGNEPGVVIRVTTPRTAYMDLVPSLLGTGSLMTLFGLGVFGMLGITLDRTVLRRLTRLSSAVREVGSSTDAEARIPVVVGDEIGDLAVEINQMLDELGRSRTELSYLAERDPLTGLYNRRYFESQLQRELEEGRRLRAKGAIVWFDLDHFKDINDGFGHAAGDELLDAFGRTVHDQTRAYCTVARLGGDEFGVLIPHAEESEAVAAATRIVERVSSQTFTVGDHEVSVSVSAGVVLYPEHGGEASDLLERADVAMYDAKARGGNQVVTYATGDVRQNDMTQRLEAAERILAAIREDRLLLYAQPIRRSEGDGPRTFELLLRMQDEDGNLVLPDDIIPTAERLGLIRDIDRWVAKRAIGLLAHAQEENLDVRFSINLSGNAFADDPLLDIIRDEFRRTGASPERLIIEITETMAIVNIEAAVRFIRILKGIGCRFALDDFGSPESSYYYLKHLPVDYLKIDGSIVAGLTSDSADAHIVRAITDMCRGLNILTIAEYVEDADVLEAIDRIGVDFVQGYHVGMPEPLDFYLGDQFAAPNRTV